MAALILASAGLRARRVWVIREAPSITQIVKKKVKQNPHRHNEILLLFICYSCFNPERKVVQFEHRTFQLGVNNPNYDIISISFFKKTVVYCIGLINITGLHRNHVYPGQ